ncbi:acyl carrier protein [Streptomyces sp. NPDC058812]|uniref:acyl carrier protein n=1 Tax=unclassified Streptomyces TaxID=2593676 RepID=UPI00368834EF
MITPRLCAPAYELGEHAESVAGLPELQDAPEDAVALRDFDTYHWSEVPVVDLMATAVHRTLSKSGVPADRIDMVLLATESLPPGPAGHREVAELLEATGMAGATVTSVGLMDCATAVAAVGTAASLVRDGTARNVLVVGGDLADLSTGGERVVAGGAAIASDGAAAALLSATAPGLPVLAMAHHSAPRLLRADESAQRQLMSRVDAYRELFARLTALHPVSPRHVSVLPSNFAPDVMRMYLSGAGFGADRIDLANVARVAHCQGSDPLISLADRLGEGGSAAPEGARDEVLMLLGAGVSHLAAVLLGASPLPPAEEGSS